jgi:hypothetical protein
MAGLPCQTYPEKRYALLHQYNTHCEAGCVLLPFVFCNAYQSFTHSHAHTLISVILKDRHDERVETHTKLNFYGLTAKADILVY